jgi:hypothetical protein
MVVGTVIAAGAGGAIAAVGASLIPPLPGGINPWLIPVITGFGAGVARTISEALDSDAEVEFTAESKTWVAAGLFMLAGYTFGLDANVPGFSSLGPLSRLLADGFIAGVLPAVFI